MPTCKMPGMKFEVTVTAVFTISGELDAGQAASAAGDKLRQLDPSACVTDVHVHRLGEAPEAPDPAPPWHPTTDPSAPRRRRL